MPDSPLALDATSLYSPFQQVVRSWTDHQEAINVLGDAYPVERFVWRGQSDARWGLTSSMYRSIAPLLGRVPTEADVVDAEKELLRLARTEWRLDGIPALQLFAQLQHVGAPTRLIDATWNPLIAAWFAVSAESDDFEQDARLFAFTVKGTIGLHARWNGNAPRWHPESRFTPPTDWGTGLGRRVWQPPALHARIPAQSAVFLVDGVPLDAARHLARVAPEEESTWTPEQLRAVASIPVRFSTIRPKTEAVSRGLVFTYRITSEAKRSIRRQLEDRFGYRAATIYADIQGLAEFLKKRPDKLLGH